MGETGAVSGQVPGMGTAGPWRWLGVDVSPEEAWWAAAAAAVIVLLATIPYLIGWTLWGRDFLGHVYTHLDANVHLAWMRQGAEGRWVFTNRFTSEPQQPHFVHALFLVMGRIAAWFGGSYHALIAIYHVTRVLCGWLLLVLVYALAAYVYPDRSVRRAALCIAGLSSGFGWLLALAGLGHGYVPDYGPDLLMPETVTFLSIAIYPLFAASLVLVVLVYLLLARALDAGGLAPALAAGGVGLLLANTHTYDLPPIFAVLGVYLAVVGISRRRFPHREMLVALVFALASSPAILYQFSLFQANPVFRAKALASTPSPPMGAYVWGLGLLLGAGCAGAVRLRSGGHRRGELLVIWMLVTMAAAYAPVSFQRKMIEGAQIPLAVLAASGWMALRRSPRVAPMVWLALFLALSVPSNVGVMWRCVRRVAGREPGPEPGLKAVYALGPGPRAALGWLDQHARDEVVLSGASVGNYMPAWCGVRTYVSHGAETIDARRKARELRRFLDAETPADWRESFLRREGIRYFYYSAEEQALGRMDPAGCPALARVFAADGAAVYAVRPPRLD